MESEDYSTRREAEGKEVFDVISMKKIDEYREKLRENAGIELPSYVSINIMHPGDDLYNHYEIQHKLYEKCNWDWKKMIDLIKFYGYNPDNITIEQFKDVAGKENIRLEGKFPGFAMAAGDDEINFFSIKEENIMEMAVKYAEKEGKKMEFSDIEDAKRYLESLGEKYFLHETGHIVYKKIVPSLAEEWENFVGKNPDLRERIIEIQKDKYSDTNKIPIAEEAFADFFIGVSSGGGLISRLGKNKEADERIRALLAGGDKLK